MVLVHKEHFDAEGVLHIFCRPRINKFGISDYAGGRNPLYARTAQQELVMGSIFLHLDDNSGRKMWSDKISQPAGLDGLY